ncbi:MAG: glycerophosphodiester phosphodiesterase [Polyangiaceae bacterium]
MSARRDAAGAAPDGRLAHALGDAGFAFRRAGRPFIYGHRGVRGERPENTLAAFTAAAEQGADGIELDVRVSRDGEPVVAHDPTLSRVSGGADPRAISDMSWRELALADAGGGERLPRLVEVLALARARHLAVNIELKRDAPDRKAIVTATARLLSSWDARHPVVVSSFDPFMLAGFGLLCTRPRALLLHRDAVWHQRASFTAAPLGVFAVHIERTLASPRAVRRWHARGMRVSVWTVNDEGEARDLAAIGVDGLITDVPGRILAALR